MDCRAAEDTEGGPDIQKLLLANLIRMHRNVALVLGLSGCTDSQIIIRVLHSVNEFCELFECPAMRDGRQMHLRCHVE